MGAAPDLMVGDDHDASLLSTLADLCRSESHRCTSEQCSYALRSSVVIVSLLYKVSRRLLSVPAVLLRGDTSTQAELLVLRHENAVLRRQLKSPVRYESADRLWFAALSSLIPRRRWHDVFPVAPASIPRAARYT
jgi:putative transposase